jgi:hypothetical protein
MEGIANKYKTTVIRKIILAMVNAIEERIVLVGDFDSLFDKERTLFLEAKKKSPYINPIKQPITTDLRFISYSIF